MADVAVIGAGIVGLATAYELAELGAEVRVYESGAPGNGQSGGESRIFRHAHDDPRQVEMAKRSREGWREWEAAFETELVSGDGVIALGESACERLDVLNEVGGLDAREITGEDLGELFPLLSAYDGPAVFDPGGGAIRTTAAIAALSSALGDRLLAEDVISLRPTEAGSVEVRSGGIRAEHERVVVCAGRGTAPLARTLGISLPVQLAAHLRITFDVAREPPETLPCLQDGSGEFPESGIYAAPEPGNRRFAVGLSETIDVTSDGGLLDPGSLRSLTERTVEYVREALPGLDPEPRDFRHCWVTEVPWSEDGLAVWEQGGILLVAGHNLYKMAPALGRDLAAAAGGADLRAELRPECRLGAP